MTSIQLLLLNLLYDILCLILPWDNVDEEQLRRPLEWSGRTLSRFMRVFGPVSSLFDLLTFAILFFVLCPALCGGSFFTLGDEQKTFFISLFQTGWFLESMWTQVLILQLLRTRRLAFFRTPAARLVLAVTVLGILAFTLLPLLPAGQLLGLTVMPPIYYLFLVGIVILYLLLPGIENGILHGVRHVLLPMKKAVRHAQKRAAMLLYQTDKGFRIPPALPFQFQTSFFLLPIQNHRALVPRWPGTTIRQPKTPCGCTEFRFFLFAPLQWQKKAALPLGRRPFVRQVKGETNPPARRPFSAPACGCWR